MLYSKNYGVSQATAHLLQRIGDVQPDKLRPLLDKVFPFVSVEALRPIVVKVRPLQAKHAHNISTIQPCEPDLLPLSVMVVTSS